MISSADIKGNYLKCINLGVDHYLIKPVSSDELEEAIFLSFPYITDHLHHHDVKSLKSGLEILVVEDNKINSLVTGRMLSSLGYKPDYATDGEMATKLATKKRYDLILMDLVMPKMDGYEAAKKILAMDKTTLIVALTADNMPDARRKAELSGIKEFVSKPIRIDLLKSMLRKYYGDNQPESE
jgi:CheY-like chemotaxis protein